MLSILRTALLLLLLTALATYKTSPNAQAEEQPNIILIMTDDMGYADASCYGNTRYRTPHIDALAAEGMRFTDYHASGPACSPTRAALLTGRYQQRAGIGAVIHPPSSYPHRDPAEHFGLKRNEITLAHLLKAAGYTTGITGKWHLGYEDQFNPTYYGFDFFRGYVSGNVDYQAHYDNQGTLDWWLNDKINNEQGYTTHLITQHATQFIQQHAGDDQPFFLYVPHEAPHNPWQGPNDPAFRQPGKPTPEIRTEAFKLRAYREMMIEMDKGVGQIVDTVKKLNLASNTFIFFCSDNGATPQGNNGPLNGFKLSLLEGGIREPAIAWWPGKIEAGSLSHDLTLCIDVMPTLLELAGAAAPANHKLDGTSLAPLLFEGKTLQAPRKLFWDYAGQNAMRDGEWKYFFDPGRRTRQGRVVGESLHALFNLDDDLGEQNNLAAKYPKRFAAMQKEFAAWKRDVERNATKQPDISY